MSEQKSQKKGVRSNVQKRATSHREYDEMPASGPKAGASGKHNPNRQSDKDAAHGIDESRREQRKKQWSELERSEDV